VFGGVAWCQCRSTW